MRQPVQYRAQSIDSHNRRALFPVPINLGIVRIDLSCGQSLRHKRQAADLRSISISLSQAVIWFQLGILWDAKHTQQLTAELASN